MESKLRFKAKIAPEKAGVYIFKNGRGEILYVGKAKNISKRVSSYFSRLLDRKTAEMVSKAADVDFIITDNEVEALILENNLIKKNQPPYNIMFKDGKSYPYLAITLADKFPRVMITRDTHKKGVKYYGPYTSVRALRATLDTIRRIFTVRTCKTLKPGKKTGYPCLNYHIERCLGPCTGKVDEGLYGQVIKQVIDFLEGKPQKVIASLTAQMQTASNDMEFEKAARIRNRIIAAKKMMDKQKMVSDNGEDQDIIGIAIDEDLFSVEIFNIRGGKLIDTNDFFVKKGLEEDTLASFLKQYYSRAGFIPKNVILPQAISEQDIFANWLREQTKMATKIVVPQRGKKKRLVELANTNASHFLEMNKKKLNVEAQRTLEMLKELSDLLGIPIPQRIECFDISNIGGTDAVGSMVVFLEGWPAKDQYRRFKIYKTQGPNDFAMMKEVISRRLKNLVESQKSSFKEKPDVIIVDGGKPQLSAALSALSDYTLSIPVIAIAKKQEELYIQDKNPVVLESGSRILHLIQQLRDEAHRFAVSYHRKLRSKRLSVSALDGIIGIGEKRKQLLLKEFGSLANIRKLSVGRLQQVPGIGKKTAKQIISNNEVSSLDNE